MATDENLGMDALKAWSEYQKTWLRFMGTSFPGVPKATEDAGDKYDWTSQWRATGEVYDRWLKMSQEMIQQSWKESTWGTDRQTFEGMLGATHIYNKLYEFWTGATQILSGDSSIAKGIQKSYKEYCDAWIKNSNDFFNTFFMASGVEPMKRMGVGMDLPKMYADLLVSFIVPWMEATQGVPEKSIEALRKGPQGYADIYRSWLPAYEQTWGKILKIPPMGVKRQSIERLQRLIETMIEHGKVLTEYSGTIYRVSEESMQKVTLKLGEMYTQGQPPKTYREFYSLWWITNEDALYQLFKTPEFSRLLGRVVDVTMRLQQRYNIVMEEFLKALPIPTRSEMDDLYKTLYLMNKEVKNSSKRMKGLDEKLRTTEETLIKKVIELEEKLAVTETIMEKQLNEMKGLGEKLTKTEATLVTQVKKEEKLAVKEKTIQKQLNEMEKKLGAMEPKVEKEAL